VYICGRWFLAAKELNRGRSDDVTVRRIKVKFGFCSNPTTAITECSLQLGVKDYMSKKRLAACHAARDMLCMGTCFINPTPRPE